MKSTRSIPFRNLTRDQWQNLALAAILAVFTFYFVLEIGLGRLCGQIGVDYCDYWSAARVASEHGYVAMYDLQILDEVQKGILPATADPTTVAVVPFPYLPVFILPFQLFAQLPPEAGFIVWSLINLAAFGLYFHRYARNAGMRVSPARTIVLLLASLPVFHNFYGGQVSVMMAISVAEFMRWHALEKPFRGGLWLGVLLLKPQALLVLAPLLLLQRSFRTLVGLAVSGAAFGLASLAMIGPSGLQSVLHLWRLYAEGRASNWVEGMLNFRMLGLHLSAVLPAGIVWPLIAFAMAGCFLLAFLAWRRPVDVRSTAFGVAMLGILSATVSIAWHAHIHMAMLLVPPLILLYQRGSIPRRALELWVFLPSGIFLLTVFVPPALARLGLIRDAGASYIYLPFAAAQLFVDLYLFYWALSKSRSDRAVALKPS